MRPAKKEVKNGDIRIASQKKLLTLRLQKAHGAYIIANVANDNT